MRLTRRTFLGLVGAGLGVQAVTPLWGTGAEPSRRPNIVLFMVDDMGWQDTSVPFHWQDGKPVRSALNARYAAAARTPNMERLARRGMTFTNAYACAVCSPSRCSLMSGMNAARHRVTDWTLGVDQQNRFAAHGEGLFPPRWSANGLQPPGTEREGRCQPPWRVDEAGRYVQPPFGVEAGALAYRMALPYTCALPFPELLRRAGYRTIHVGKAHWGSGAGKCYLRDAAPTSPGADPRAFGFDVNVAGCEKGGPANYRGASGYGNKGASPFSTPGLDENSYYEDDVFLTDALTDRALAEIDAAKAAGKPFYLYLAHYAVHSPLDNGRAWDRTRSADPNPEKDARNPNPKDGLPWNATERNYGTLLKGMDDSLGKVLDKLEALGLAEDTLVIFMADNGGLAISGRMAQANGPARAGKGSCYEGGTREPLLVAWPGRVRPGSVCHEPVIIEDFYPTLLEAAGVPIPEPAALAVTPADVHADGPLRQVLDGESFLPLLLGQRATVRPDGSARPLLWHYPNYWQEGPAGRAYHFYSAIRLGDWKLIYQHSDRTFELYDLAHDIGEARNLAAERPDLVVSLRREMGRLLRERHAQMPRVGAPDGPEVPFPDVGL